MYCKQCGVENEDWAAVCINCGNALLEVQEEAAEAIPDSEKPAQEEWKLQVGGFTFTKRMLSIIGGAVVGMVLLIVIISSIASANSPKAVVNKYYKYLSRGNMAAMVKLTHKDVLEEYLDIWDMDVDEFIEELEEEFEDVEDEMEELEWEIKSVKKLDKDDDEYENVEEYYDEDYGLAIKGVAKARVRIDYDGDKETVTFYLVKIGSKWYMAEPFDM